MFFYIKPAETYYLFGMKSEMFSFQAKCLTSTSCQGRMQVGGRLGRSPH